MATVGGSIESVSIAGRNFPVAADADGTRRLGGYESEVAANGDRSARILKTAVPWSFEGLTLSCDDVQQAQEFLQAIADGNDHVAISVTFASGLTYQGRGTLTGEVGYSAANATVAVNMMGEGVMTQQ